MRPARLYNNDMHYRAIIFDFDGVIVDSERWWEPLMEDLCSTKISDWRKGDNAKHLTGADLQDNYAYLSKAYKIGFSWEEFAKAVENLTKIIYGEKTSFLPGLERLLRELTKRNIPIGLASSSKRAWLDMAFDRLGMGDYFPLRATGDDLMPGEGKPAPTLYLRAAKMLGIDPKECIAIEDSHNGALSAKAAGMYCIGMRNGFNDRQDLSMADECIHGFAELDGGKLDVLLHS
ncbi:HAD-IA family hydrolase [Candidatus Peregrinibacteria bacterium]|nr:HAD-IA family hydrolase [Candidatus Peregrinibacteria bacterium]